MEPVNLWFGVVVAALGALILLYILGKLLVEHRQKRRDTEAEADEAPPADSESAADAEAEAEETPDEEKG